MSVGFSSAIAQRLGGHAWPILVGQLASISISVADTVLAGHYSTDDLAAVAVASGLYISIVFAFVGILQAVAPIAAHHVGAHQPDQLPATLQNGLWLALTLSLPAMAVLVWPGALLSLSDMPPAVDAKVRTFLATTAVAMPAALGFRTLYGFINALGKPRVLMAIQLTVAAVHVPLAWSLMYGKLGLAPLGAQGSAVSTAVIAWLGLIAAASYLRLNPELRALRLFAHWHRPDPARLREILRLGLPIGFSNFVEITSFTLIALFVAQLGAAVVGGHRIVANLAATSYMLPLSLAIATLVQVGQNAGARDWQEARRSVITGLALATTLSTLLGVALWLAANPIVALYTSEVEVAGVALSLIGYIAAYQFFDAIQTVAAQALRGYKVTFLPAVFHVLCFWGLGLGGGYWLAFRGLNGVTGPMGVAGFWGAAVIATVLISVLLGGLLARVVAAHAGER